MVFLTRSDPRRIARQVAQSSERPRICLIEENPLAAAYVTSILEDHFEVENVCPGLLARTVEQSGRVVLVVDINTLSLPASEFLPRVRRIFDDPRIIVLDFPLAKPAWLPLLPMGIRGFVPYSEAHVLRRACEAVCFGKLWLSPELLEQYVESSSTGPQKKTHLELTAREKLVAELIRQKLSNKEVGCRLQITESTVKFHVKHIFSKLHIHNRFELPPLPK
jgi:two-component system nitrate/nitrite response regulator NarL